jgi:hypothetical protein
MLHNIPHGASGLGFENEAKGYARGENDYVILTDDDLETVALDTVRTIDIEKFVPAESICWTYLEKAHYLTPDDRAGQHARRRASCDLPAPVSPLKRSGAVERITTLSISSIIMSGLIPLSER